jgi:hypothetical protein
LQILRQDMKAGQLENGLGKPTAGVRLGRCQSLPRLGGFMSQPCPSDRMQNPLASDYVEKISSPPMQPRSIGNSE